MFAALLTMSFAVAAAEEPKLTEAAQKELKKFDGKWKPEKIVANGKEEMLPPEAADMLLEFKARKLLLGEKEMFEVASLDPSTEPKCLDLKALASMGEITKDTVYEAIYKFEGDTLMLAMHIGEAKKRPAKFESEKDSGVVVVTLKREKK
jgi:uncharacterized protein (TIGR03067 family)